MTTEQRESIDCALNVPALVRAGAGAIVEMVATCGTAACTYTLEAVDSVLLRVIERARGLP